MSESEQTPAPAGEGHNSNALSDDQQRALALHHKRLWEVALKAKAEAAAAVKKIEKQATADGVTVADLKRLRDLDGKSGDAALRKEIERSLRLARWMGAEVGQQFSFLDEPDRTPVEDRAFERGKIDGMKGETARTPEGYSGETEQAYLRGWRAGQDILMSALELTKARAAEPKKKRGRKKAEAKQPAPDPRQSDVEDVTSAPAAPAFTG